MPVSIFKKFGLKFSLNDPRWGRGNQQDERPQGQDDRRRPPNDGPPDLEQFWNEFNQRLARMFGNRRGGGNGGNNGGGFRPDAKGTGIGIGIFAAILAFLWLVSGFFIVQEGQTGVIMTFGRYSHTTTPGFNWRWPGPIQSHEVVNISTVRTVEVGYRNNVRNKQPKEALMLTDDENIIDIQFAVQYRLKSASDWIFSLNDPEDTVKQVAETSIREIVGRSKMDFVLYEGREKVAFDTSQLMQQILDRYQSGVQITNVTMQGVQPPEQVQASFDDAVKAGQDRERLKNEGQAYANDVVPRASGAASRLQQESEGYRSRVVAAAEGDASRFKQILTEYQKAPAITRERLYLETMQQVFSSTTKVMMDTKNNNSLMYLPLDKLISESARTSRTTPANPAATIPVDPVAVDAAARNSDARTRDIRSARDREGR